ncbi:MAG: hypothetical protein CTY20_05485 [Hyphomicrobium sp.]|nr:MAG: hypothetical protein CTY20_05485 [Hyphomicrobium sp.]
MTRTIVFLFAIATWASAAIAGPGHDHGGGEAAQPTAEIPRIESVTADIELVATAEGHKLTIFLDAPVTNEPIEGAKIVVEADGKHKAEAKPKGNGVYELEADWVDQPGVKALVFTVTTPTITDLLNGTLDIHGPEVAAKAAPLDFKALLTRIELWIWSAIAAALGFFLSFAFRPARAPFDDPTAAAADPAKKPSPRIVGKAAALALASCVAIGASLDPARAGPGHDHGDGGGAGPTGGNVPRRQADGSVFMPKPAQRLLRIRTASTSSTTAPQSTELLGTVISDPRASGRVQAPFAGRIEVDDIEIAFVGQRVAKGDVLAGLVPTVSSVERGSVGQQLAELDGSIAQAEQKVARLSKLVGSVPQADIDQARSELKSLRERRTALSPSLFGKEKLRAPVAGIIAAANVRTGQVVDAREVLFEIVDPERLWIEAVGFASIDEKAITEAHAVVALGQSVPLKFLGRAPELKQQSLPLLFKVENVGKGLSIGRSVPVLVQAKATTPGIVLPEAAVVRAANGLPQVWEKLGPEKFAAKAVRTAPLDGQRVLVTDGLTNGQRIVVDGAEFINQVR